MHRITFSEFLDWLEYLRWEEARTAKLDYYLAQIAVEVRRSFVTNPRKVNIEDFILSGKEEKEKRTRTSKQAWAAILNVDVTKSRKK